MTTPIKTEGKMNPAKIDRKLVVAINRRFHQSNKQKLRNAAKRAK